MRKTVLLITAVLLAFSCGRGRTDEVTAPAAPEIPPVGFIAEDYIADSTSVKEGETFGALMSRLGMDNTAIVTLIDHCDTIFDLRKMRAGSRLEAYYSKDSLSRTLEYVEYHRSKIGSTIFKCRDTMAVWNYEKPTYRERHTADITIRSSLWNDMVAAGAHPSLIVNLADIYQWSVNFFALQEGDRFRLLYSQKMCDGEFIAIDSVYFAIYNGSGKEVSAVMFSTPGTGTAYWGKGGESLKRMFLKAPLKYNRISSGFTYHRRHPVTGKVRAHTAVDYAAPTGTPVHAIGDGKVTAAGWDRGGGGNRIRIKHAQGYESAYLHLSRFAPGIKAGKVVSQGELIGYVGSTGMSTGPHLDFRIWQNGKPVNPLSLDSPQSEPLDKKYLDEFNKVYDKYMSELERDRRIEESGVREGADEFFLNDN